ncbi:MAG TPA: DUF2892 domain-containing protein [Kofleriaceae bacterium]|nr:DUF2892 domain-containing protein [Kofleriaceae bacterium]
MKLDTLFPANEHRIDRALRVLLGVALVALAVTGPRTPWGWLGLLPLLTGLAGSCPAYTLLGIRTRADRRARRDDGMPSCCGGA